MLLRVLHETLYDYSPGVDTAQHQLHLQPLSGVTGQTLLSHRLLISPPPDQQSCTQDVYGNAQAFFALHTAHDTLRVSADSLVQTSPHTAQLPPGATSPWETVRDHYRYRGMALTDEAAEFVFPSPYIPRLLQLQAYGRPSFAPGMAIGAALLDLMSRIHADFTYETASTNVNTPVLEALEQRKGVCQDFAHIMIGCLRGLGLPARYASGYLLTAPPPGQARLVGSDASHAWVQAFIPQMGTSDEAEGHWFDLDPTNNRRAGEDYVLLAVGRDFSDVSPMRGVLHGGANHQLRVQVTVAPPDDALWTRLDPPAVPPLDSAEGPC